MHLFESPDFVIFRMGSGRNWRIISTLYCSGCAWGRLLLWLAELYHFDFCRNYCCILTLPCSLYIQDSAGSCIFVVCLCSCNKVLSVSVISKSTRWLDWSPSPFCIETTSTCVVVGVWVTDFISTVAVTVWELLTYKVRGPSMRHEAVVVIPPPHTRHSRWEITCHWRSKRHSKKTIK